MFYIFRLNLSVNMDMSESGSSQTSTPSNSLDLEVKMLPVQPEEQNAMEASSGESDSTGSVPSGSTASLPSVITANVRRDTLDSSGTSRSSDNSSPSLHPEEQHENVRQEIVAEDLAEEIVEKNLIRSSKDSAPISVPKPSRVITGFEHVDSPSESTSELSPQRQVKSDLPDKSAHQCILVEPKFQVSESDVSPSKMSFGSLLSQRLSGMMSKKSDVLQPQMPKSPQKIVTVLKSPVSPKVSLGSPMKSGEGSPLSQKSFTSTVSQNSSLPYHIRTQVIGDSSSTVDSTGSPKGSKKSKNLKWPLHAEQQPQTRSELNRFEQSPASIRSLFGSITIWNSRPILSRHLSQGGGSSTMVNYVTEAQSVVPSLTSAFSIDHLEEHRQLRDPVEMAIFDIDNNQRAMSHQDQLDILDILEQNEYVDTVKSTDSAASLLRRSLSVPPQYHYKPQKLHVQDIFNQGQTNKVKNDPVTGKNIERPVPANLDTSDVKWRQTMDDLLERPEYLDSVESACSRTGLLASQARAMAQQYGTKRFLETPTISRRSDQSISTKQLKFIYFKNLIVLSLGFMFTFMSYMSLRNLQSSLYKAGGLGIIALSCVYASLFLGCVFAPTVVQKLRPKNTIMMCISGMFLYVLANFYPSYYTLIPACAITGFCLANLWTAHATYLASVATRYAILSDDKIQNVLSHFNGIFFAFFQTAQIIGGLISSLVLAPSKETAGIHVQNITNMSDVISVMVDNKTLEFHVSYTPQCGAKYCSYYEDNLSPTDPASTVDQKMVYILVGVYAACMIAGFLVIAICLDPLDGVMKKSQACLSMQLTAVFRFFSQWKVACLTGLMFYTMLQSSFMFGEFTKVGLLITVYIYYDLNYVSIMQSVFIYKYKNMMVYWYMYMYLNLCLQVGFQSYTP